MGQRYPLVDSLQEAVEKGLLTTGEAWQLQDELLTNPMQPWPQELVPLHRRWKMLQWETESMTRQ